VVNYIERYEPELLTRLAPVHSPTLCTAVYLRKYAKVSDAIAFLSPCVAKSDEFAAPATHGLVAYNVTYARLLAWIEARGVDLAGFEPAEYDDMGAWLGAVYSRPGGLRENVETVVPDAWVRQVEGQTHAYPYLAEYRERAAAGKPLPLLVDVLNCAHGCNLGTATLRTIGVDDADFTLNAVKRQKRGEPLPPGTRPALFDRFDRDLRWEDFRRTYADRRTPLAEPAPAQLEAIWIRLHKTAEADRTVDCSACGYDTCRDMALAIHNGFNAVSNCIRYNQVEIEIEAASLQEKTQLIDRLADYSGRVVGALGEISRLNLDVAVPGEFDGDFAAIRDAIETIARTLDRTMREIRDAADQFTAGAAQVSEASASLAGGVEEQSGAVERLTSLAGRLTAETERNAASAARARDLSAASRKAAADGNFRMAELLQSMDAISRSSADINKILATIDSIAFQTNLLALNAAIEAARAGKYGKGFSVVADEVRRLAGRCSAAAKESADLIRSSGGAVGKGTALAQETAAALQAIDEKSAAIADAIAEIADTSGQQSAGIAEINGGLKQVGEVVRTNAENSQRSAAASQELSSQAEILRKSVARFRLSAGADAPGAGALAAADLPPELRALLSSDAATLAAVLARMEAAAR
jgi:methyl-accepting chemotaxis protein